MAFFTERPIPERPYFKVGEVASLLGVAPSAVRYWQKEFPNHIKAELSHSGQNVFSRNDVIMMAVILNLVRLEGLSIKDARGRLTEIVREHGGKVEDITICQQFELPLCTDVDVVDAVTPEPAAGSDVPTAPAVDHALVESLQAELAAQLAINESLAQENVNLKRDLSRIEIGRRAFEHKLRATLFDLCRDTEVRD